MLECKLGKEEFTKEFRKLFEENRKIVLFGAGEIGMRGVLRLDYLGLKDKIVCFGDNNASKWGNQIEGITVIPKEEILERYPDASIIITVGNQEAAEEIHAQLVDFGFRNFISRQALLHRFEFDGHREKALVCVNGRYILRQTVVSITECCTLRCKNCSQLMPRFQHPQHMETGQVLESISRLTDMVDYIQDLTILGGEPLINPDLPVICEHAGRLAQQGKIKVVSIVSNATLLPKPELLSVMKKYGIKIMLSDYGALSNKMEEIQRACEMAGVEWRYAYSGGRNEEKIHYWSAVGSLERQNLTQEQLDYKFLNCNSVYDCNMIYRGRYFFCCFSAFLTGLGLVEMSDDSFNLLEDVPADVLREKWHDFMRNEKTIAACDFCNMHGRVPMAEQM